AGAAVPVERGPTRVSTSNISRGGAIRLPQLGQNLVPSATCVPHLLHGLVATAGATCAAAFAGGRLPLLARGSSATGDPHRLHCGTPIGVNALHASQTRPTSIRPKEYPYATKGVKERTPSAIGQ